MLNTNQQAAVKYTQGPCLVLAGAGSGKTRVITEKIQALCKSICMPEHIYAVTFTNKAAKEMKERAAKVLSAAQAKQLNISTFHTLGLNILRSGHELIGYRKHFSLFDEQDAIHLLQELAGGSKVLDKSEAAVCKHKISRWKMAMRAPEVVLAELDRAEDRRAAVLYQRYQDQLRTYHAVDFDDLIILPLQLLQTHADFAATWQDRVRYLLVDEYQDTNAAQYQMMKLLVAKRHAFTVVGDDDQSIYAWRGAQPENLALLQRDFPDLHVIKLEENYRSTGTILQAANALIANNDHLFPKSLKATLGYGEPIRVIHSENADQEAERVVSEIMQHHLLRQTHYHQYAILYRGNHQALAFEKALRLQRVPYKISGGQSFFGRAEIKDLLCYCRLLANPQDDAAFVRIVNVPRREIGPTTLQKLGEYANQRQKPLLQCVHEVGLSQVLSGKALANLQRFAEWVKGLSQQCVQGHIASAIDALILESGYEAWLESQASNQAVAEARIERVKSFRDWLVGLAEETPGDFAALMQQVLLQDRQDDDQAALNQVQLLTLHASKGLEFPYVYLVGFEEGLLPHQSSIQEDNLAEERRLAYVGITRAQEQLTLTLAKQRQRFGDMVRCQPSRFLAELPQEVLRIEGEGAASQEQQQQRNQEKLALMRAMLDK